MQLLIRARTLSRLSVFITFLSLMVVITSCGTQDEISGGVSGRTVDKSVFTGAYADDLYNTYKSTKSNAIAEVLSGGDLSEQDMIDIENIFSQCMKEKGITVTFENHNEALKNDAMPDNAINDNNEFDKYDKVTMSSEQECNDETGFWNIQTLFNSISKGKTKFKSEAEKSVAVVECYKRHGIVGDDYTVEDYHFEWGNTSSDHKPSGTVKKFTDNPGDHSEEAEIFWGCQDYPDR